MAACAGVINNGADTAGGGANGFGSAAPSSAPNMPSNASSSPANPPPPASPKSDSALVGVVDLLESTFPRNSKSPVLSAIVLGPGCFELRENLFRKRETADVWGAGCCCCCCCSEDSAGGADVGDTLGGGAGGGVEEVICVATSGAADAPPTGTKTSTLPLALPRPVAGDADRSLRPSGVCACACVSTLLPNKLASIPPLPDPAATSFGRSRSSSFGRTRHPAGTTSSPSAVRSRRALTLSSHAVLPFAAMYLPMGPCIARGTFRVRRSASLACAKMEVLGKGVAGGSVRSVSMRSTGLGGG